MGYRLNRQIAAYVFKHKKLAEYVCTFAQNSSKTTYDANVFCAKTITHCTGFFNKTSKADYTGWKLVPIPAHHARFFSEHFHMHPTCGTTACQYSGLTAIGFTLQHA